MRYKVKLDIFEGPFDLLVYLIENAKMSIYDIQVSDITNQYIKHVEQIKKIDTALAGEFMVLAASLIEIKSKMLLPRKISEEDGSLCDDPRDELVQRLLEYKKYKSAAAYLEEQELKSLRVHVKPREDLSIYLDNPEVRLNLDLVPFIKSFHVFLEKKKKLEEVQKRYSSNRQQQMSIESRIEQIKSMFKKKRRLKFWDLINERYDKQNIVLTFISMLELIRQKSVRFNQNANFEEITFIIDDEGSASKREC